MLSALAAVTVSSCCASSQQRSHLSSCSTLLAAHHFSACSPAVITMVNFGNFRPESIQITLAQAGVAVMSETYLDGSRQDLP